MIGMIRTAALALAILGLAACTEHARDPSVAQVPATNTPGSDFKDATKLFGLLAEDVNALFGEPRQTRRDGPAQVWQYASAVCVLDLFLYTDTDTDPTRPHVTYFEAREDGSATPDPMPCLRSLLRRDPQGA